MLWLDGGVVPCRRGRKRWILSVPVRGAVRMDAGAVRAVEARGKSLFSAGLVGVSGDFSAQDAVQLCDAAGRELGRGLCNYSAAEVERIKVGFLTVSEAGKARQAAEAPRALCSSAISSVRRAVASPVWELSHND